MGQCSAVDATNYKQPAGGYCGRDPAACTAGSSCMGFYRGFPLLYTKEEASPLTASSRPGCCNPNTEEGRPNHDESDHCKRWWN